MDVTEFYKQNLRFLNSCANKIIRQYGCGKLFDDLVSAGSVVLLEQAGRYDEAKGASFATFVYPHILGAMRREVERYHGLPKREFEKRCESGMLSQFQNMSLDEADEKCVGDHPISSQQTPEAQVYIQVCLEHLRTAFYSLSYKERAILGGFFGVYGHKKETLAAIGESFQMGENAAQVAKDKALVKLRRVCVEGELGYWRSLDGAIREFWAECALADMDCGVWGRG
jgi:RNA polymerase sigma factor (sigma-70 family)